MGWFVTWRRKDRPDYLKKLLARNLDEAEARYLEVLRRELANLIVSVDPDLMVRCFAKASAAEREMDDPSQLAVKEAILAAKFPAFKEFDLLDSRHFVPYHRARGRHTDEALCERYQEISQMLVVLKARSEFPAERKRRIFDDKDQETLRSRMQDEKDRRLRIRIDQAISRYYAYRAGGEVVGPDLSGSGDFDDGEVTIKYLPTTIRNEYCIHFKKTGDYALYAFEAFDDGKLSYNYYRSDASFSERVWIGR